MENQLNTPETVQGTEETIVAEQFVLPTEDQLLDVGEPRVVIS